MRLMQLRGIRGRLRQRVAGWLGRRALALLYHRVVPTVDEDPQQLCVSSRHFAQQIQWLRDRFDIVPASHLGHLLTRGWRGGPYAVVTFDDGYADNLRHALPVLEAMEVPATIFVTTGQVGSQQEFWWDELERLTLLPSTRIAESLAGLRLHGDDADVMADAQRQAYEAFHRLLKPLDPASRHEMMARLRHAVDMPEVPARDSHRALTRDELRVLADSPLIELGAHTVDHVQLSAQSLEEQTEQIHRSIRQLHRWTGRRVRSFSYPFGLPDDIGRTAVQLVESSGVEVAFAALAGVVWSRSSRWTLPRLLVRDGSTRALSERIGCLLQGQRHVA